jgi:putative NADPH-quinone reductase
MPKRIAIIQGHPDGRAERFGHALAAAYAAGAAEAGHELRTIAVASLEFDLLRTKEDYDNGAPPDAIRGAQEAIAWAEHLVIVFPLWLGTMPALLKGFFEQVFRPGFGADPRGKGEPWRKCLAGRSARIVVTMGMPAFFYRWYFRAHGLKGLERNILGFCGIGPVKETLIGRVEAAGEAVREGWLAKLHTLGREGR